MTVEDKVYVPYDEAVNRLPDKPRVHTFVQAGGILIGADWDREDVLETLRDHDGEIEETGPAAMGMNHGLAVPRGDDSPLFIETQKKQFAEPK